MSARSRAKSAFLVFAILALFGFLILLIGSLDELPLQPGRRLPGALAADEEESISIMSKICTEGPMTASAF